VTHLQSQTGEKNVARLLRRYADGAIIRAGRLGHTDESGAGDLDNDWASVGSLRTEVDPGKSPQRAKLAETQGSQLAKASQYT
jgi:hypothetical protein